MSLLASEKRRGKSREGLGKLNWGGKDRNPSKTSLAKRRGTVVEGIPFLLRKTDGQTDIFVAMADQYNGVSLMMYLG